MKKLATGSSIEKGWEIVSMLREVTKKWPPPVGFMIVLPDKDKVEIWASHALKDDELKFLKKRILEYVKGLKI